MIGYYVNTHEKPSGIMGGASKNKKIRDRVDSEGKYGRWMLRVMSSWYRLALPTGVLE